MIDPLERDPQLHVNLDLVGRYVAGEASPQEREALERWMAAAPARRELVAQLEQVWRHAGALDGAAHDDVDVDAKWRALRREMQPTRVVALHAPSGRARRRPWLYAAAAAAVLTAGAGALWRAGVVRPGSEAVTAAMREYVTRPGRRAEFRLPDGTRVMLGVASRLRVPADYGARDRRLYLDGEAYFEVEHDSDSRFFVHTGDVVTEDLGTRFAVRAYPSDSAVRVVVAEGRVALRAARQEALLGAGQLGRATGEGRITTSDGEDLGRHLAWTTGRLELDGTPLRDALPELSRWFDLDFRLGDSALAARRVTGSFQVRPDDRMLAELALTFGVRIERAGRVVTLYQQGGAGS